MVDRNFRLTSVEESQAPEGHRGAGPWYRYVIENDLTTIYGYGHGSRRHVTQRAKDYIEQLNARNDPAAPKWPSARGGRRKR